MYIYNIAQPFGKINNKITYRQLFLYCSLAYLQIALCRRVISAACHNLFNDPLIAVHYPHQKPISSPVAEKNLCE